MKNTILYFPVFYLLIAIFAQSSGSPFIRLDQFGYRPESKKVAVIADPVAGFDAAQIFSPGNVYEVRRVSDFAEQVVVLVNEPSQSPAFSEKDVFEVFPNPAGDSFFVRFPDAKLHTIQVFDNNGKLIFEKRTADIQLTVEIANLPAGVYRVGVDGVWKQMVKRRCRKYMSHANQGLKRTIEFEAFENRINITMTCG